MKSFILITILILFVIFILSRIFQQVTVFEYENALRYKYGKFRKLLDPGWYWYIRPMEMIQKIDMRSRFVSILGQEVLSSDHVSIKISLAANYKIADAYLAINNSVNYQESLYLLLQLRLRDMIGSVPVDELLAKRGQIGEMLLDSSKDKASEMGISLLDVNIKDIMFPGELKNIYAQIVNARNQGLAALERARGESAALRNLANAAKMLEDNPALLQLRILQAVGGSSGNAIILSHSADDGALSRLLKQKTGKEHRRSEISRDMP